MVLNLGLQSFAQYLLCSFAPQTDLASASAPYCTLDQEIFEKKRPFATVEQATAGEARYFTICGRSGRSFNPDDLILRCTVWALKLSMPHRESESSSYKRHALDCSYPVTPPQRPSLAGTVELTGAPRNDMRV